jgi:hypothetical protein
LNKNDKMMRLKKEGGGKIKKHPLAGGDLWGIASVICAMAIN